MSQTNVKDMVAGATLNLSSGEVKDHLVSLGKDCPVLLSQSASHHFTTVSELGESIASLKAQVDSILNQLITQVEEQIVDIKSTIIALDHILPEDEMQNSQVVVMNTSRKNFLEAFASSDAMEGTTIGRDIRATHLHSQLRSTNCIHGIFPLFALGSTESQEAERHCKVLLNLAKMAQRNVFHVYFAVDIPKMVQDTRDINKPPLQKYSGLAENNCEITEWLTGYENSPFCRKLQSAPPNLLRRLTCLFNPYLGNTETLQLLYREQVGKPGCSQLLDKVPWVSPVAFMAQRLVRTYESMGWCGGLFGLSNSETRNPDYSNQHPELMQKGLSLSQQMGYRYGLTLYNFLSDGEGQRLIKNGFSPVQRQSSNNSEGIALLEAQTLLMPPKDFAEQITAEQFQGLSRERQGEYRQKALQKMYNYLGNCLLEDTVTRGIMLVCRQYVGQVSNSTQEQLKEAVKEYLTIFAGKPGASYEPYNTFTPALESYEISKLEIKGQTAFVEVKIKPAKVLRRVQLNIDMDPLSSDFKVNLPKK